MSMTPYTGETLTIANIGTTPQERAMETSEFKMAFSKDFHEFVEWFNETHNGEIDEHMAEYANHGNLKNKIINGNFAINQRRASTKAQPVGVYGYDMWKGHANGLEQVIEALPAGTYTLSWQGGGSGTFGGVTSASPITATVTAGNKSVIVP